MGSLRMQTAKGHACNQVPFAHFLESNKHCRCSKCILFAVSLLGDICANSNAPDALAAQLLSHNLGLLEVNVYNGYRSTCLP